MDIVKSINSIPIRLTDERWIHIVENHDDLAGSYDEILNVVESPDFVIRGYRNALIALKSIKVTKFLAVIYKEVSSDNGFIITAYFSSKIDIKKEDIVWQQLK